MDFWTSANVSAETALATRRLAVWRLPVFSRSDSRFLPLGDLTGEITLPLEARVTATPFRLLSVRPGVASTTAQTERSRYRPDLLIERVQKTGRLATSLYAARARY